MSKYDELEEKLFLTLNTIEELTEQAKQQQENLSKVDLSKDTINQYVKQSIEQNITNSFNTEVAHVKGEMDNHSKILRNESQTIARDFKKIATEHSERYGLRSMALYFGIAIIFILFLVTFFKFYVPSPDKVIDLRIEYAELENNVLKLQVEEKRLEDIKKMDISSCDGRACVKVQTDKCHYGADKQNNKVRYCIIHGH